MDEQEKPDAQSNEGIPNSTTRGRGRAVTLLTMLIVGQTQDKRPMKQRSRADKGKAIIQSLIRTSEDKISNLQTDLGKRKKIRDVYKNRERTLKKWERELNERYFYIKNREHVFDILKKKVDVLENKLKEKEGEIEDLESELTMRLEEIEVNKKILYELQKIIIEKQQEIDDMKTDYIGIDDELDTKRILWVLDELLGSLPKDLIEKFAESDDFQLYEAVLRKYNV